MKKTARTIAPVLCLTLAFGATFEIRAGQPRSKTSNTHPRTRKKTKPVPAGTWGGMHVRLTVTANGAEVEFDCAHGSIDRRIVMDRSGRFDVNGTFELEGGPVTMPVEGSTAAKSFVARYRGRVTRGKMILILTRSATGYQEEEFSLTYGQTPTLEKCY